MPIEQRQPFYYSDLSSKFVYLHALQCQLIHGRRLSASLRIIHVFLQFFVDTRQPYLGAKSGLLWCATHFSGFRSALLIHTPYAS